MYYTPDIVALSEASRDRLVRLIGEIDALLVQPAALSQDHWHALAMRFSEGCAITTMLHAAFTTSSGGNGSA